MSAVELIRTGNRRAATDALDQLKKFEAMIESSPYFDAADMELVTNTRNTFQEKLETTAALSEIISQRMQVIEKFDALASTFREMMGEFARRVQRSERDATLNDA